MENLTPHKYKMVKDIEKLAGICHYVTESSCCAKSYRNGSPVFFGQTGEVLVFLLQTHKKNLLFHIQIQYKYGSGKLAVCSK